ncbi:unnamed protein product, partial [Porites lobata]
MDKIIGKDRVVCGLKLRQGNGYIVERPLQHVCNLETGGENPDYKLNPEAEVFVPRSTLHTRKHTSLPHAQDSVAQGWNKGTKKDVEPNHIKIFVFRKDKRTQEDSARDHRDNLNVKNQFNPRRPQDRQLTNERVSSLINHIIQNIPSTCALNSIGHTKDDSLPELLLNFFMSSEEMKGNLLRPSVLTLYEMRIFMSRTHSTESTSLKISIETP